MTDKPKPDWEAIERDFRLGRYSVRELGQIHGVAHTTITRRAAKAGWTQDKSADVRARAQARLLALPAPDGSRAHQERTTHHETHHHKAGDAQIEAAVEEQVSIHLAHRAMGRDFRALMNALVEEARQTTASIGEIQDAIEDETRDDKTTERRTRMMRAVSLPSRASTLSSFTAAGRNIQWIERLARNLAPALPQDAGATDQGPYQIVQFEDAPEA